MGTARECMHSSYGSRDGESNWNPEADLAPQYGIIDILDLVTIASHYGETYLYSQTTAFTQPCVQGIRQWIDAYTLDMYAG